MRLLVVEDDPDMGRLLERGLAAEGFEVTLTTSGMDALIALGRVGKPEYALAAVDVMMPGMSGFEVCRHIRESGGALPILLLTARDAVSDRVYGLDAGADDYLTKPFEFAELTARIRALLRRDKAIPTRNTVGRITLDSHLHRADLDGRELPLSPKEFALLRLLATHAGTTVSRATILDEIWGGPENIAPNIVEQYVSYLRRKLDAVSSGLQIATERGTGYALEVLGGESTGG
ncbi:response regulator transcription factor [Luethyella okanaganae]|uniref:Response regulator transcription factor n=1 Tax=Luethyella okanaganae TaxID=69372 RepID=A0ABW1VH91_9MICO